MAQFNILTVVEGPTGVKDPEASSFAMIITAAVEPEFCLQPGRLPLPAEASGL
jgi:hypothetical protein